MSIYFDEHGLRGPIESLPAGLRLAFAAACAERLLPAYREFSIATGREDASLLAGILAELWRDASGHPMSEERALSALRSCLSLVPDEDDGPWIESQAYADDAAAAVCYCLRLRMSGRSEEAAWAARRAYEAVDYYVTNHLGVEVGEPARNHALVQQELLRQELDLLELAKASAAEADLGASIGSVQMRARTDAMHFLGSRNGA